MTWDAIVIGAGCAGLAAATQLAEAGYRILVLERRPLLGGRASSFQDHESGETIDNGQHLFLGCYEDTQTYLKRIGTLPLLKFHDSFSTWMIGPEGERGELAAARLPGPWHLAWGLFRYRGLSVRDRMATWRVAQAARRADPALRSISVGEWLRKLGQSEQACRRLWYPLTLATLNADPEKAPADLLAVVFRDGFLKSRKASRPGLSTVGLSDLHGIPSKTFIEKQGGEVRTQAAVRKIVIEGDRVVGVESADGETLRARVVISAVPPPGAHKLLSNVYPKMDTFLSPAKKLIPSCILSVHAWTSQPVFPSPYVGFWDRPFHWAFRKDLITGDPGVRHVSMVISAAGELGTASKAHLRKLAERDLGLWGNGRPVPIERSVIVREPEATWIPPVGDTTSRLSTRTPIKNVFLAGDWTDTGLPATIEGAVRSGHAAAREAVVLLVQSAPGLTVDLPSATVAAGNR